MFTGVLSDLAPMASPQPGAPDIRVFELVIDIEGKDERLKPGMSAEVEIIIESIPDALAVPLNALVRRGEGYAVYRFADGGFEEVPIELGPQNATAVVVTAGLTAGDIVALKNPNTP